MELCVKCRSYSMEFDPHQGTERCLNYHCGWINRDKVLLSEQSPPRSFEFSRVMEERVRLNNHG